MSPFGAEASTGIILASTGSYPRIGDTAELQILRRTLAAVDRGERTAADLAEAVNEMTRRAIGEQVDAGVELITDGQAAWYDPVSHLAGRLDGVRIKGLLRFFDTNFYFRQPELIARPKRTAPLTLSEYVFAANTLGAMPTPGEKAGRMKLKPVLTGPYTLAKSSLAAVPEMHPLEARVEAFTEALAAEVKALGDAGANFVQVDEPAILRHPEDWPAFEHAVGGLARVSGEAAKAGRKLSLALYVYFHDCAPLYEKLVQLPVDALGLDFTYNPKLVDAVATAGSPVPLGLGLVDGRNTRLEEPAAVARQIEKLLPRIGGRKVFLGPSCGLEYLPRDRAYAKLELLGRIRAAVTGV